MKKTISLFAALLFICYMGIAQVPANFIEKFKELHPDAAGVMWSTVDEGLYKVSYTENNVKHVQVYNKDMMMVWKRSELTAKEFPPAVQGFLKSHYPEDKDYQLWVIDENGKTIYYSPRSDKKIVYLDQDGNVVKTVWETGDYPKAIVDYYTKKYPEEKYAIYSVDENGNTSFYTLYKGKILYFDKQGNFIREDYYYDYETQ